MRAKPPAHAMFYLLCKIFSLPIKTSLVRKLAWHGSKYVCQLQRENPVLGNAGVGAQTPAGPVSWYFFWGM